MVGGQYNASTLSCPISSLASRRECQRFLAQDMLTRSDRSIACLWCAELMLETYTALTRGSPSARSRSSWPSAPNTALRPWRDWWSPLTTLNTPASGCACIAVHRRAGDVAGPDQTQPENGRVVITCFSLRSKLLGTRGQNRPSAFTTHLRVRQSWQQRWPRIAPGVTDDRSGQPWRVETGGPLA